jgi:pimeloyl-ACP methyl ester carboxylesterase
MPAGAGPGSRPGCEARGWGAFEGDPRDYLREEISDADFSALLDAVGFERPALVADSSFGGKVIHFSVSHPERVSAVILINGYAYYVREDDYPWGFPPDSLDRFVAEIRERWGTGGLVEVVAPSRVTDERFRTWFARSARHTRGPNLIADMARADLTQDVRPLLPSVSVPTLVIHSDGNRFIRLGRAGTWRSTSPMPSSCSSRATTGCSSWVTPTLWWTRSKTS